jgi:hypothetical protein
MGYPAEETRMSDEGHEIRMRAGQTAMTLVDAVDDELLELLHPAMEAMNALASHLRLNAALSRRQVFSLMIGLIMEASMQFGEE